MPVDHREKTFESAIEDCLLGECGYTKADPRDFDKERCLDSTVLLPFLRETQPKEWAALEKLHGKRTETIVLDDLCKALDSEGSLPVLRHGFKCFGKRLFVAFFAPATRMNPETAGRYRANRLTVTRQLQYCAQHTNSLDLALSLNGLPIATAELKNPLSGQTVKHAIAQYRQDRDPRDRVFEFKKRSLVHFAVDPDEVYMATRLDWERTFFLPFNKGNNGGKGNPDNPKGYKTAYLWEEVWQRDAWLDILARFLHLEVREERKDGKKVIKETMIFPRYHQWDSVRRMEADARQSRAGKNYLVQHSAGSGKSNSIGWLAHRLSSLHDENDEKIFHSVVVITDRLVLDKQLQDTIYQFEHKQGVVQKIEIDSSQLAQALKDGTPIIITTLQKFPFVAEKVGDLPSRNYAVIVDEAHSSQSGETATELKGVLSADVIREQARKEAEEQGLPDYEEEILKTVAKRGQQPNLSFFGFTATPKYKTLEVFGVPGPDGKPAPFHLYSMRQAIEEGFILDVLEHYSTYKTYFRLIKSIEADPKVEKRKAAQALARFMSFHPYNVAQKTEVMIEHFRASTKHKIGGRAKAMVVTRSRAQAVRYKLEFDKYIKERGYRDVRVLVAFSGEVEDEDLPGKKFTEVKMNGGIKERELPEKFDSDEYHVLIVAEKYQTGFDQPLLHTMYVDKRLDGIQAVQTLSRLNRTCAGKEDTFALDFVNEAEEIQKAFQPFYERTMIGEKVDPRQLYDLQAKIMQRHVVFGGEIEEFARVYYAPGNKSPEKLHPKLYALMDPAVARFDELTEEEKEEYRGVLSAFRNLYSFLSQVIPYQDTDLEKLYTYVRFLLRRLPRRDGGPAYDFDDEVRLKFYRLQKISEGSIALTKGQGGEVPGPTAVGTGKSREDEVELSSLIETINDRFGTDFTKEDELFFQQIKQDAVKDEKIRQTAEANTLHNFGYVFDKAFEGFVIARLDRNQDVGVKVLSNQELKKFLTSRMRQEVYDEVRAEQPATG
ncbi:MAG: type I restriction endonuclease [Bryobacterales bacterium]